MSEPDRPPRPPRPPRQPVFNLPPAVAALIFANLAVHGVRLLLPEQVDFAVVVTFGFIPARYTVPGLFGWPALVAPVTHLFLHGGLLHLLVNMAMLMAFGSGIERRVGAARMLGFGLVCGLAGAATHLAVYPTSVMPVIGASGAISGYFGGVLRVLARAGPRGGGRPPLLRLWPVALIWIAVNLLFGWTGLPGTGGAAIAWAAHIGGFTAGLLLFPLFDRPRQGG